MKCPYCQEEMQLGYILTGTACAMDSERRKTIGSLFFNCRTGSSPNQSVQTVKNEWI